VQARGPWPRDGLNGKPRPKGRTQALSPESFHYAELTRDGAGVFFRDLFVTIPWVEIDMDQLRRALAEKATDEAAPASSGSRKRLGRPPDTSMATADKPHLKSMSKLVKRGLTPNAAAAEIVGKDGSGVRGPATPESKIRRLRGRFKQLKSGLNTLGAYRTFRTP
jgi:hypothetical protein